MKSVNSLSLSLSPLLIALTLAAVPAALVKADAPNGSRSWTVHDLEEVTDAAIGATAGHPTASTRAFMLLQLTGALAKAGHPELAKPAVEAAVATIGAAQDLNTSFRRGQIVEWLARLGETAKAEALAASAATPQTKAMLNGGLGAGLAQARDIAGAQKVAKAVMALPEMTEFQALAFAHPKATALAHIGLALEEGGAVDAALEIADALPNGVQKLRLLGRSAEQLCKTNPSNARGPTVAQQAVLAAENTTEDPKIPIERSGAIDLAATALAVCETPQAARSLVEQELDHQRANVALRAIADRLFEEGRVDLARSLAPLPDRTDPESLLDAARRFAKWGDKEEACRLAVEASETALKRTRDTLPRAHGYGWNDHLALLSRIAGSLADLGLYDRAIATVQPWDPVNRRQFYRVVIEAAIRNGDHELIQRILPGAIDAANQPARDWGSVQQLAMLARSVARGGEPQDVLRVYGAWKSAYDDLTKPGGPPRDSTMVAEMQLSVGDVAGALAMADQAGPLTETPSPARAALLAAMMFDNPKKPPPTKAEIAEALARVQQMMPALEAGPKANVLSRIARDLASAGKIDAALQVEAGIEAEPRDVLAPVRDGTLKEIAEAQRRAGKLQDSLATTLHITAPMTRWEPLLALAAIPPWQ